MAEQTFQGSPEEMGAPQFVEGSRPQDTIVDFVTAHGSVYTYDQDGHTTRFETAVEQERPTQDITVFVDLTVRDLSTMISAYLLRSSRRRTKVFVAEKQADDQPKIITNISDVTKPDELVLATFQDGQIVRSRPASLFPRLGAYVFDSRQYEEAGVTRTERHLGHKVTEIHHRA